MGQMETSLHRGLHDLGVQAGDSVMMHVDAMVVGQFRDRANPAGMQDFFSAIEAYLGRKGTLIIPTFSYSFTKNEVFSVRDTPSDVGMLSELFRHRDGVHRSPEPIFSVAASGGRATELAALDTSDCFGADSIFQWLVLNDAKVVCLACDIDRMTFFHYAEQMVPVTYRYKKRFSGTVVGLSGIQREKSIEYFVRDLDVNPVLDATRFKTDALRDKLLTKALVGRVNGWALGAKPALAFTVERLREQPYYLLRSN